LSRTFIPPVCQKFPAFNENVGGMKKFAFGAPKLYSYVLDYLFEQKITVMMTTIYRSGWNSGGRMASAEAEYEWGGVWRGVSPSQPTRGFGGGSWAPQRGLEHSPGRKRILSYVKGHRAFLVVYKIWGWQFALASPTSNYGGLVPRFSRDLRPGWQQRCPTCCAWHWHILTVWTVVPSPAAVSTLSDVLLRSTTLDFVQPDATTPRTVAVTDLSSDVSVR